jgi:hypothetical protein
VELSAPERERRGESGTESRVGCNALLGALFLNNEHHTIDNKRNQGRVIGLMKIKLLTAFLVEISIKIVFNFVIILKIERNTSMNKIKYLLLLVIVLVCGNSSIYAQQLKNSTLKADIGAEQAGRGNVLFPITFVFNSKGGGIAIYSDSKDNKLRKSPISFKENETSFSISFELKGELQLINDSTLVIRGIKGADGKLQATLVLIITEQPDLSNPPNFIIKKGIIDFKNLEANR